MSLTGVLTLTGLIDRDMAALFGEQLAGLEPSDAPIHIELEDADVEDGVVVTMLVDYLRTTARRVGRVELHHAPQVIAHTLYRVGALSEMPITLIDPREEIGRSS